MTIDAVRNSYMNMMKETRGMDRQPFLSSHFQFKKIILTRSIAQTTTIIFTSKTGFFAFSIKLYPCFCPFLDQKSVFQVVCVVAVYPENAENKEMVDFNKNP